MLLTTSATSEQESSYNRKVEGWCFSYSALTKYFPECIVNFDADSCEDSLLNSKTFMDRLDPYYFQDSESPFYKKRFRKLPYLPVAVRIIREC